VGIVTIPFKFEGNTRYAQAQKGLDRLRESVDSLIVINNNKLREIYGNLGFKSGFSKADEVLATAAKGIAEVITHHYLQNIDLIDAKTVLSNSGTAIMGASIQSGEGRAQKAIASALDSPLLNDNKIKGAKNVLLLIVSGSDEITLVGHLAVLNTEVIYVTPEFTTIVPAGFLFDGASIPQFAWSLIGHPYTKEYRRPAAVHDYHYRYQPISSKLSHVTFYHALRTEGVAFWRARSMFHAVNIFGPKFPAPPADVRIVRDVPMEDPLYKLVAADLRHNTPRSINELETNFNMCYTEHTFEAAVSNITEHDVTRNTQVAQYLQSIT
jgi:hypothetical protein